MDDSESANHEQEAAAAAAAPSIVCEYCLKSFTSGKAYGGHKRIHLQHQQHNTIMTTATTKIIKDEQEKEKEPPATAATAAEIGSDQKNNNKQTVRKQIIRCSECFRFFKSWKSLFGHMRAHPERDWRGIKPPPSSSFSINASSTSCTISNLQLQIQIQDQDEYDDDEEEEEDEDFETPDQVLDLADSLRGRSWLSCDIRGRKAKIITTDNNLADDMNSSVDYLRMLVHQAQNPSSSSEAANQAESIPASEDDDDVLMNPIPKKKMKVEKLADHSRQCVCSICNKSFPCYQALGGHMASHNKGVIKKMAADQEGELDQLLDTGGRGCSVKIEEGDHQCNICGLSFPTGQALGGHKKRHWWSPNKEVTTTNPKAPLQSSSTKKLEFDLNEVPKGSD